MLGSPFRRRVGVVRGRREGVFRREPVVDRDDGALRLVGERAAAGVLAIEVADDPAAAVEVDEQGQAVAGGAVDTDRDLAGRPRDRAVFDVLDGLRLDAGVAPAPRWPRGSLPARACRAAARPSPPAGRARPAPAGRAASAPSCSRRDTTERRRAASNTSAATARSRRPPPCSASRGGAASAPSSRTSAHPASSLGAAGVECAPTPRRAQSDHDAPHPRVDRRRAAKR